MSSSTVQAARRQAAQPRRRGHRDSRQSSQNGRIREPCAGQPRSLAQPGGQCSRAARPGQIRDSSHQRRSRHEPARHGGQHPEPAVPQRGHQQHQGRRGDRHLHQASQHPPGRGRGPDPGDRGRRRPQQGRQQRTDHGRRHQHPGRGDQADHIARMAIPRRRQDTAPRTRLRLTSGQPHPGRIRRGRLSGDCAASAGIGWRGTPGRGHFRFCGRVTWPAIRPRLPGHAGPDVPFPRHGLFPIPGSAGLGLLLSCAGTFSPAAHRHGGGLRAAAGRQRRCPPDPGGQQGCGWCRDGEDELAAGRGRWRRPGSARAQATMPGWL